MIPHPFTNHLQKGGKIILFDSSCNLCNRSLQFILKRDRYRYFMVASLQSELTRSYLEGTKYLVNDELHSLILLDGEKIVSESTAIFEMIKCIPRWRILYSLTFVPKPIRDPLYRFVAKNRYKWPGKREQCTIPAAEIKARFFDFDRVEEALQE